MEEVDAIATNCNKRKMAAKKAEVRSSLNCLCSHLIVPSSRLYPPDSQQGTVLCCFCEGISSHTLTSHPSPAPPTCPSPPQVLGELHERGMVIQVLDKAFDVVVAQYGAIQRVHTEVSTGPSDVRDM